MRFVSHEVRSPVNVIELGLDIVKSELKKAGNLSPSVSCVWDDMKSACEATSVVLNDILNYENIEGGMWQLDRTILTAFSVLEKVATALELKVIKRTALHFF